MRRGEVQDRRRHEADVYDVEPGREHALDEASLQGVGGPPVVLADGDPAPAVPADERAVGRTDQTEDVGRDVAADEAAHVVGAEHVRIEHCAVLFVTLS